MEEKTKPLAELAGEYELIGQALLELISSCPHIPSGLKLLYNKTDTGRSIGLLTGSGNFTADVLGGFTATIKFQIAYKSFPVSSQQSIENQAVVDKIMKWLSNTKELPKLTDGRIITKIKVSNSFPVEEGTGKDKSVTYVGSAVMEYEK